MSNGPIRRRSGDSSHRAVNCDLALERKRGYTDIPFVHLRETSFPMGRLLTWAGAELSRRVLRGQDRAMAAGKTTGRMDPWLLRLLRKLG